MTTADMINKMRQKNTPLPKPKPKPKPRTKQPTNNWVIKDDAKKFRLPEGSRFEAVYSEGYWRLTLTTPDGDEETAVDKSCHWAFHNAGKKWKRRHG